MNAQDAILVHGYHDHNGVRSTDRLRPHLEARGLSVIEGDYGYVRIWDVYMHNDRYAGDIARAVSRPTIGIGHSNGCAILRRASYLTDQFEQLVFINPALDRSFTVGDSVKRVIVLHSPSDRVVWYAKFLPRSEWGDMGRHGYKGSDPRFVNVNIERDFPVVMKGHQGLFHSTDFPACAEALVDLIVKPF